MGPERQELTHAEVLGRWTGAFVDELAAAGVEHVCLCPGSRSTPLALTFARHPTIKVWTHLDERSCAYFGLGMAKASGRPVAILCSSGTAAVNFAPAVVEAYHSRVALIVLTADRPPELQGLGANQTIDQQNLYGTAVKWSVSLPLPEGSEEMLRYVRMVAARAVGTAGEEARGPVHLNFPFREPLVPVVQTISTADSSPRFTSDWKPASRLTGGAIASMLSEYQRPVIVCGPETHVDAGELMALAGRLGVPVLAEPLSNLRCGPHVSANVIGAYDAFLRLPAVATGLQPDFVLRFGDPPTGRALGSYLQRHRDARQVLVAPPGRRPDPDLTADEVIEAEVDLTDAFAVEAEGSCDETWLPRWHQAESAALHAIESALTEDRCLSEITAVTELAAAVPSGYGVFAGNSMPVRDLDCFYPVTGKRVTFYGNRGASGIDGVISTALGAASASNDGLVLVIGDLSFYHDMNGLLAAKRFGINATIVLINNDGGGIFSFLPQNDDQEHFEALFGTPHGLDFAPVADLYGVGFQRVATRQEYREALSASFATPGVQVIEIKTDRVENLKLHQRIWQEVAIAVSPARPEALEEKLGGAEAPGEVRP